MNGHSPKSGRSRVPWRSNEAQSRITGNFVPSRRWRAQENCRAMPPAIKVANVLRGTRYPVDRSQVSHLVHDRGFRCRWKLTYVPGHSAIYRRRIPWPRANASSRFLSRFSNTRNFHRQREKSGGAIIGAISCSPSLSLSLFFIALQIVRIPGDYSLRSYARGNRGKKFEERRVNWTGQCNCVRENQQRAHRA